MAELYIIAFTIVFISIISLIIHKIIVIKSKKTFTYHKTFAPLYTPIIAILTLVIIYASTNKFIENIPLLYFLLNVSFIWLIASIASICTKNPVILRAITYSIVMVFILDIFDVLDDTIRHLDSIAITLGNLKISVLFLLKLILSLIVILWGTKKISYSGIYYIRHLQFKYTTRELMVKFFEIAVYFIAFLVFLNVLGIDLTTLGVISGAIFFGIGIGLQKIVLNLISGILILLEDVIKENDIIELENGTIGYVQSMGARYIMIKTFTGKEMLIPNEEFIVKSVTNWTLTDTRVRLEIIIPLSYKTNIKEAQKIILDAVQKYEHLDTQRQPNCFLSEFDDSVIKFKLRFWVDNILIERTQKPKSDVMFLIWESLQKHKIELPLPQREIYMKK